MSDKFYFLRQPDRMIECSDNLPSCCNIEVIKARHKIFKTREEAEKYQAALGVEPLSARQEMNKDFRRMGMAELYGYESKRLEQSGNHELTIKDYREFVSLVKRMREAQKRQDYTDSTLDIEAMHECRKLTKQRESEVDEYLKQMEI